MEFFSDYHEHPSFQPAMLALAHFAIQWNWAEHNFNVLLWALSGDFYTGAQYTAALGNQSRADLMLATARRKEKDPKILELIEFSVKAFGRIKDNRNALLHAHSVTMGDGEVIDPKPRWIRASNNPRSLHIYCNADEDDIIENLEAASLLGLLLPQLTTWYIGRVPKAKRRPSLGIFPLPKALKPTPVAPTEPEPPRRSSRK